MFDIVETMIYDFIDHLPFYVIVFIMFGFLGTFFFNKR